MLKVNRYAFYYSTTHTQSVTMLVYIAYMLDWHLQFDMLPFVASYTVVSLSVQGQNDLNTDLL